MDNFRVVAAVLVVLLAFTGFQLIANYSLRRAVRDDVKQQVEETKGIQAEMMMHHKRLQAATRLMDELSASINTARAKMTELEATLGKLEETIGKLEDKVKTAANSVDGLDAKTGAIEARLKALETAADALKKKIGLLDGAAAGVGDAQAELKNLQRQLVDVEKRAKAAGSDGQSALTQIMSLKTELSNQKRSVDDLRLDEMKRNMTRVQDDLRKLTRTVETLRLRN